MDKNCKIDCNKKNNIVQIRDIKMGNGLPIIIQSMTSTLTSDVKSTVNEIIELADAGSQMVRMTVNDNAAAASVPEIKNELVKRGYENLPLIGCFHYNGHTLLSEYPECAQVLDKYRINPGNVGFGDKKDRNFETIIELAIKNDKAIRIGVNWGSLDEIILNALMEENMKTSNPKSSRDIIREAVILSTCKSAEKAEDIGLPTNKIVVSAKVSRPNDLIYIYEELHKRTNYALHLGLTEAGMGNASIISTSIALGILLSRGIGHTIRASITPRIGESRANEVIVCKNILQSLELQNYYPSITSCPGCGRTSSDYFRKLTQDVEIMVQKNMPIWSKKYIGVENLKIAVMGCIVNGPGESKHADIGISLPGNGENPVAVVYLDGEKFATLKGNEIEREFFGIIEDYIAKSYNKMIL